MIPLIFFLSDEYLGGGSKMTDQGKKPGEHSSCPHYIKRQQKFDFISNL